MESYEQKTLNLSNEIYGKLNSTFSKEKINIPNCDISQVYVKRDNQLAHVVSASDGYIHFLEDNKPIKFSELTLVDAAELLDVLIKIKKNS